MKYKKRTSAPIKSMYYYQDNVFQKSGYGMWNGEKQRGNCTAYAWGRFYEITGSKPKLCTSNAENWFKYNDGYKRGKTPKLGAVIVWSKGIIGNSKDGAGHVAVVEEIYDNGSFLTSNSGWNKKFFYTKKIAKNCRLLGYKFEGFIYPPIEFEDEKTKKIYSGAFPVLPKKGYLGFGDKGTQIARLQKFLNWCIGTNLYIDSSFGNLTKEAVLKYQKQYKLTADGKFGPASLSKAKTIKK